MVLDHTLGNQDLQPKDICLQNGIITKNLLRGQDENYPFIAHANFTVKLNKRRLSQDVDKHFLNSKGKDQDQDQDKD